MEVRLMCANNELGRRAHRAAVRIHNHLLRPHQLEQVIKLPQQRWDELQKLSRHLQLALGRGWYAAGQHVLEELDYTLKVFRRELEHAQTELPASIRPKRLTAPHEMAADLASLAGEFEQVTIDLEHQHVSVLTEAIVLEGVYLGPYRIVLHWNRIGRSHPYEIVSEGASAAESDRDVIHPHVRDQTLCEGDGAVPIRAALSQGRLLDFFVLVHQILQTYNDASAHVSLNDWDGVRCADCGYSMPRDERSSCDRCDETLCGECSVICSGCDRYLCSGCTNQCGKCSQSFCSPCLATKEGTSQLFCSSCLEEESSDDQTQESPAEPAVPAPAIPAESAALAADPVCLGEAAAPPRPRRNGSRRV